MVKAYLKWKELQHFGIVASSIRGSRGSGATFWKFGPTNRLLVLVCALDEVKAWDLRTNEQVFVFSIKERNENAAITGSADLISTTCLAISNDGSTLAVGYSDGSIRLWKLNEILSDHNKIITQFSLLKGHKSAVSSLCFNDERGHVLSASVDTTLCLWDIASEKGICKLRGHTGSITACCLVNHSIWGYIAFSSSKDGHIKVWDLTTESCRQTLVGHRGEVNAIILNKDSSRLFSAGADIGIRVWRIIGTDLQENGDKPLDRNDPTVSIVEFLGIINRNNKEKIMSFALSPSGTALAAATSGKDVEILSINDREACARRRRRRLNRARKKKEKNNAAVQDDGNDWVSEEPNFAVSDEISSFQEVKCQWKICSITFCPAKPQLLVTTQSNTIEVFDLTEEGNVQGNGIRTPGHRSDVRALSFSDDTSTLVSTSTKEVKVWNRRTGLPIHSFDVDYGLCCAFLPQNRYVIVGTKAGTLHLLDASAGQIHFTEKSAHSGPIWALQMDPTGKGFVTGSADKTLKFWSIQVSKPNSLGQRQLSLELETTVEMNEDVLALKLTKDGKYLAVALLDCTVKVFFADTMKFFLSLYGHSLPVMSTDISSDNVLIVSGSADKNVKIWGMDFGDCRRSIFAHSDSVMKVAFIPRTHYFFSCSKDGTIKLWDGDKFDQLLSMKVHFSEIWAMDISREGTLLATGSNDRSIRIWEQTAEQFFLEEAQEDAMDEMIEGGLVEETKEDDGNAAAIKTIESLKATERILEALQLAIEELFILKEYELELKEAALSMPAQEQEERKKKNLPLISPPQPNPLLLGKEPALYVFDVVRVIRSSELEPALSALSYTQATDLLNFIDKWLERGYDVELCTRCTIFLLRVHHKQMTTSTVISAQLRSLRETTRKRLREQRNIIGFNRAALNYLKAEIKANDEAGFVDVNVPADEEKAKKNRKKRKNKS